MDGMGDHMCHGAAPPLLRTRLDSGTRVSALPLTLVDRLNHNETLHKPKWESLKKQVLYRNKKQT